MRKFSMELCLGLAILFAPDSVIAMGGSNGRVIKMIKVKDLTHAPRNTALREKDGDKTALATQQTALQGSITRGKGWKGIDPLATGENGPNWLSNSIFKVELNEANGLYEVLAGSHRLEALQNGAKENPAWNDFEVPCYVVTPRNDAERDLIIVQDNGDGPEAGTVIKMSPVTRFATAYGTMPRCDYICAFDNNGKAQFVDATPRGWTSDEYLRATNIGGSNHVPFSALTRLGKHFDIPVEMFNANRLRVKSQVTAALLNKTTKEGEGSAVVSAYGKGFEIRYKEARAAAKRSMDADEVKATFKAEFLALMDMNADAHGNVMPDDVEHDGSHALGQTPTLTADEKKTKKEEEVKANAEKTQQAQRSIANAQKYAFQKWAVANAFNLPEGADIDPNIGNALDLLFTVTPDAFKIGTIALSEYKRNPTAKAAVAAAAAIVKALESLPGVTEAAIEEDAKATTEAAHGKPNTPKNKHKGKK